MGISIATPSTQKVQYVETQVFSVELKFTKLSLRSSVKRIYIKFISNMQINIKYFLSGG